MTDSDMRLGLEIVGNATSAVSATTVTDESLDRLSASVAELTAKFGIASGSSDAAATSISAAGTSAEAAAVKTKGLAGAETEAVAAANALTEHSYMLARGLDAAGLAGEAAATRVGAMGDALASLQAANPAILAVVAALTALAASFSFLKSGTDEAIRMQQGMQEMRIAIESAGGSFEALEPKIEAWAKSASIAAGITGGEAVDALNRLVQAGTSVNQGMTELSIGMQMAAAGMGRAGDESTRFATIVQALVQAEGGHYMLLQRIDPAIANLVKQHASLSEIMGKVNQDTRNAISSNDDATAAHNRLRGAMSAVSEEAGKNLLPIVTDVQEAMAMWIDVLGHVGQSFGEFAHGAIEYIVSVGKSVADFGKILGDLRSGHFDALGADLSKLMGDVRTGANGAEQAVQGIGKAFYYAFHPANTYVHDLTTALDNLKQHAADVSDIVNPSAASTGAKKGGSSLKNLDTFNVSIIDQAGVDALVSDWNRAMDEMKLSQYDATGMMGVDWTKFVEGAGQKMDEDRATFMMTNSEKADYYKSIWTDTERYTADERKQAYSSYIQAVEGMDKDRYQKWQQLENQTQSHISNFLDQIVVQHQTMASALKGVYNEILQAFDGMIAQMLAKTLMAMPWFEAIFGLGGAATPINWTGSGAGPSSSGLPGTGSNAVGAGSAIATIASSPAIASAMRMATSPSGGGGSVGSGSYDFGGGGGVSPDISLGGGNPFGAGGSGGGATYGPPGGAPTAGTSGAQPYSQNAAASPLGLTQLLNNVLKGPLGKLALGFGVGDMAAGLTGGNSLWGSLGGGLGAGLGLLLHANPLIGLGFDVIMGLIGSLFGNHFNLANEPDISQTDAWGQANADMQGMTASNPMNANGKQFVMDSQTASATGGQGWNRMIEKFVQQYRGQLGTLPATLQAAFPELEQLWGGAVDKQYFNPDGKDGYLDIGSGKRALWTEFWRNVTQYGSQISQLMTNQSPTEMFVASINGHMQNIGGTTQAPGGNDNPFATGGGGGGGGSSAVASGGGGRIGASLAQRLSQSIAININVRNSSTLADAANMERALRDAFGTTLPSAIEDLNVR